MGITRQIISTAGVLALVVSVSACSALGIGGGGAGGSGGNGDGAAAASNTRVSLLDEFLAPVWGTNLSPEEQVLRGNAENAQREQYIAECMHQAGFEYIPNPVINTVTQETNADSIWRPDDRAWVEEFGYAAIVSPWENVGRGEEMGAGNVPVDPNQAYLDNLTESERQAFNDALWGAPIDLDGETLDHMTMEDRLALMGCFGYAMSQMGTQRPSDLLGSDEFAPLFNAMNEMYNNIYQNPDWHAIDADWANCMADRGLTGLVNQNDAQQLVFNQLNSFWEAWDWETNPTPPSITTSPELAAIHQHELEVAMTDFECRQAVNYRSRQDAVITAAEQQFINDHHTALEALRSAAEQMG